MYELLLVYYVLCSTRVNGTDDSSAYFYIFSSQNNYLYIIKPLISRLLAVESFKDDFFGRTGLFWKETFIANVINSIANYYNHTKFCSIARGQGYGIKIRLIVIIICLNVNN